MKITERDGTETIATIYDWKFERQVGLTELVRWNIGGNLGQAVSLVEDVLCTELGLKTSDTVARHAR
jgi:hypothetical protein